MLVVINPVATKMSDRLKSLVVYALQGRYEVEAIDTQRQGHAVELCREAALAGYDIVVAYGLTITSMRLACAGRSSAATPASRSRSGAAGAVIGPQH